MKIVGAQREIHKTVHYQQERSETANESSVKLPATRTSFLQGKENLNELVPPKIIAGNPAQTLALTNR